jgi:hypothetical protein
MDDHHFGYITKLTCMQLVHLVEGQLGTILCKRWIVINVKKKKRNYII